MSVFTRGKSMKRSSVEKSVDYRKYRDPPLVLAAAAVFFCSAFGLLSYVFTEKFLSSLVIGVLILPVAMWRFLKFRRKQTIKKFEKQFLEMMQNVLSSVSAGMPFERAFAEVTDQAVSETRKKERRKKQIIQEFETIIRRTEMNYSFYSLLENFAERSGSGDIVNLSKALTVAATGGGNTAYIVRNALANMRIKVETEKEIEHILALPRYNHRIISLMPFLMMLLLKTVSRDYVEVLYNDGAGQIVIICVVLVVVVAWLLGDAICDIKV